MFRTKYTKSDPVYTNAGSHEKIVYGSRLDMNHRLVVEPKGKENLYAYINSFADSVDINVLITRFTNGDKEALLQRAGAYIDVSSMPSNLHEFIALSDQVSSLFNTLPAAVKAKFDNNVLTFTSMFGTDEWNNIMNTSQADINKEASKASLEASKAHKAAIKNSVYGELNPIDTPVPVTPVEEPKVEGGLYLNE